MKKISHFILLLLLSATILFGCSDNSGEQNVSISEMYMNAAKISSESGDIESAIAILEEGLEVTGDEALSNMIENLKADLNKNEEEKKQENELTESEETTVNNNSDTPESDEKETSVEDKTDEKTDSSKSKPVPESTVPPVLERVKKYSSISSIIDYVPSPSPDKYNGTWNYHGFSGDMSMNISISGNYIRVSGLYTYYKYFNDEFIDSTNDVTFTAESTISDGRAYLDFVDSAGNSVKLTLTFHKVNLAGRELEYINVACTSFRGTSVYELMKFYNEKSENTLKTIDLILLHCEWADAYACADKNRKNPAFIGFRLNGSMLDVKYIYYEDKEPYRKAGFKTTVDLSKAITSIYEIEVPFDDDGWGNSGTLKVKFNPGNGGAMVNCTLVNMMRSPDSDFCITAYDEIYFQGSFPLDDPAIELFEKIPQHYSLGSWHHGGEDLTIYYADEYIRFSYEYIQGAPWSRVSDVWLDVNYSDITGYTVSGRIADGWGTEGEMTITFDPSAQNATVTITDAVETDSMALWGFGDHTTVLEAESRPFEKIWDYDDEAYRKWEESGFSSDIQYDFATNEFYYPS